jgi:hypothetical protein
MFITVQTTGVGNAAPATETDKKPDDGLQSERKPP